jgi:hypothetical protein
MRRAIISTLFGLVALLLVATSASANGWCRTDPKIRVDGRVYNVYISLPDSDSAHAVVAATQVLITIPTGVDHALLDNDNGFGFGYNVVWIESPWLSNGPDGPTVKVNVYVPATRSIPVQVEWQPRGQDVSDRAYGNTNSWVTLRTTAN